jgi:hypothetical protein
VEQLKEGSKIPNNLELNYDYRDVLKSKITRSLPLSHHKLCGGVDIFFCDYRSAAY